MRFGTLPFLFFVIFFFLSVSCASNSGTGTAAALRSEPSPLPRLDVAQAQECAIRNIQVFRELLGCASGYLADFHSNLQEIRGLAVQGTSGNYTEKDRLKMADEIALKANEIRREMEHACFNGMSLYCAPNQPGKVSDFPVTLSAGKPTVHFRLDSGDLYSEIGEFPKGLQPTPESFDEAIGFIDNCLSAVSQERAVVGAYLNRTSYALEYLKLASERGKTGQKIYEEGLNGLFSRLNGRIYELAVLSANGIYAAEDRTQVETEYRQLVSELGRLGELSGKATDAAELSAGTVRTQPDAEALMLRMARWTLAK
jgi:flagellin-like hook-associated protein FlgL